MRKNGEMVLVKEEQLEAPPGFTKHGITPLRTELVFQTDMQNPIQKKKRNIINRRKQPNRNSKTFPVHGIEPVSNCLAALPIESMPHGLDLQPEFSETIANVIAKHGAIDKDCSLKSDLMKKLILLGVWKPIKELGNKKLEELNLNSLEHYYDIVKDAEKLNINVKWLLERLDEIKDAIVSKNAATVLQGVKEDYIRKRDDRKGSSKRLLAEIKKIENDIDEVDGEIKKRLTKIQKFQQKPLLDGLV